MTDKKVYLSAERVEGTPFKAGNYYFDVDGKMELKNGPAEDGYFYLNGVKQLAYQLIEFEGNYYFIGGYNKYVTDKKAYLSAERVEGTPFKAGNYYFDADGKMELKNGPDADGYFYLKGEKQLAYQLIEFEGNYYYIASGHKYVTDKKVYLSATRVEGTPFKAGNYQFDAEGKMVLEH